MHVTLVLGLDGFRLVETVQSAVRRSQVDPRHFAIGVVTRAGAPDAPGYEVRNRAHQTVWGEALQAVALGGNTFGIVAGEVSAVHSGGFELTYPHEAIRRFACQVVADGGTVEIACMIDDVFAEHQWRHADVNSRLLSRHLLISETIRIGSFLSEATGQFVATHVLAAQGPAVNLATVVARQHRLTAYLCYPINAFRRRPDHPARPEIEELRSKLLQMDLRVFDPLALDEDSVIAGLNEPSATPLVVSSSNRWPTLSMHRLLDSESNLEKPDGRLEGRFAGPRDAGQTAKAQVPQRDFLWIDRSDIVISWRPFLDGMHHAGVLSELQYALHSGKQILAFSPPIDIDEHPSPFASMIQTISRPSEFERALELVHNQSLSQGDARMTSESIPKYCDHTSVGILIFDERGYVLLIDRGTFPFGLAPPAGHVDDHASFEEAARAEAFEEVGVYVRALDLVSEGRRENPCRRVNGTWHYWKVFKTTTSSSVTLALSEREVKSAKWYSLEQLAELGVLRPDDEGPIESVWRKFLAELLDGS